MIEIRSISLLTALLASLVPSRASPLPDVPIANSKVLHLPVRRSLVENVESSLSPRALPVTLVNNKVDYLVDLKVGSSAQPVTLSIDTGSSDVWVFSPSGCNSCKGGTFQPSPSTIVNDLGSFSDSYFDGSSATGYYVKDKVAIGGASVKDVYIGVATQSKGFQNTYGIMGIGLDGLESSPKKHPGFLDDLYNQGIISQLSYSIWLDDINAASGGILFGGVDSTKWTGNLVSLPMEEFTPGDNYPRLQVEWSSLTFTNAAGAQKQLTSPGLSYPVALDTGYTTTVVPKAIFNELYSYFGVTGPAANGNYYINCHPPAGYLTFGFGKGAVSIKVPFSELAVPLPSGNCLFGLLPQDRPVISFGDTFLRSAYVNFDFGKQQIGLAQARWI